MVIPAIYVVVLPTELKKEVMVLFIITSPDAQGRADR